MYYYLFINNYDHYLSNILIFDKTYNKLQTINLLIFVFNNFNFENLLDSNKIKIVMSVENLNNYWVRLKDDKHVYNFLKDKNSIHFIESSLFGNKYTINKFLENYKIFVEFLSYMENKNYKQFLVISGIVYLLYGLRTNRDIDTLSLKTYKIKFNKMNVDQSLLKNKNYMFLINDPEYTFYFKGFKISTLKTDVTIIRPYRLHYEEFKHPKALADIIMAKKLINSSIKLPINLDKLNKNKQERVLKKIKRFYRTDYNPFKDIK